MKTYFEKKPVTWEDIEDTLKGSMNSNLDETDDEKLEYFKSKLIEHLDKLQAEEDKKIIPFPKNTKFSPN